MHKYSIGEHKSHEPAIMRDGKIMELKDVVSELNGKTEATVRAGMECLSNAVAANKKYAWGWHCNVAAAAMGHGMDKNNANKAASAFMKNAFGVNMLKNKNYIDLINSLNIQVVKKVPTILYGKGKNININI